MPDSDLEEITPEKPSGKSPEGFVLYSLKSTGKHAEEMRSSIAEETKPIDDLIKADVDGKVQDTKMRVDFAQKIGSMFSLLNFGVYFLVFLMAIVDTILIMRGIVQPNQRLMNEKIIMALISGTVIQSGVAFIGMVKYLFPEKPHHNPFAYEAAERREQNKGNQAEARQYKISESQEWHPVAHIKYGKIGFRTIFAIFSLSLTIGVFIGSVIWMPAKAFATPVKDPSSISTAAPPSASMPVVSTPATAATSPPPPCAGQPIDINITQSVGMESSKPTTRHIGKPSHPAPVSQCASTSANR